MNHEELQDPFSKSLLTGLFAGITATLCCFVFGLAYRLQTGFLLTDFINVPSIIFVCNILLLAIGMLHFMFERIPRYGTWIYIITFTVITLFCIWKTGSIQRSNIYEETIKFRGLLTGMIIIIGSSASLLIPYLYHNRKFIQYII